MLRRADVLKVWTNARQVGRVLQAMRAPACERAHDAGYQTYGLRPRARVEAQINGQTRSHGRAPQRRWYD